MRIRYFYLEDEGTKEVNKVDLMDVSRLASFSMSLVPFDDASEVAGRYNALRDYMNKHKDNLLFDCYNLLTSYISGIELLYSNIHFCLYEKLFREEKATDDTINAFRVVVDDYHRILNENMEKYYHHRSR